MVTEKLPKTIEEAVRKALFNGADFTGKDAEEEINALKNMGITSDSIKEYMQKHKCENCKWYAEFEGVCCNGESKYVADFRDKDFYCEEFEKGDLKISQNKDLLPCPFCGGEAELVYSNDNHHQPYVRCKFGAILTPKCSCHNTYQWSYQTEQEAIEAWNRRTCSCKKQED